MKKSIIAYSVSILALSANVSYAASGHYRHDRHPVSKVMPSHHRSAGEEDIIYSCANAALGAYRDEEMETYDVHMHLGIFGYKQETPNDRVFIARKESGHRGRGSSAIVACRGTDSLSDLIADLDISTQAHMSILGRDVSHHFPRSSTCVASFAEIFNDEVVGAVHSVSARAESIVFTGHSMGGALAQFGSLVTHVAHPRKNLSVVTFGSAGAFDETAISVYDGMVLDHQRYFFHNDPVAKTTGPHAGVEIKLKGTGLSTHRMREYYDAIEDGI